jgi:curved DNA-binding protein CbpA
MDEIKTAYRTLAKKWHPGEWKTKNKIRHPSDDNVGIFKATHRFFYL